MGDSNRPAAAEDSCSCGGGASGDDDGDGCRHSGDGGERKEADCGQWAANTQGDIRSLEKLIYASLQTHHLTFIGRFNINAQFETYSIETTNQFSV